jgi:glycerophosphoryl diester phosphodiesterase
VPSLRQVFEELGKKLYINVELTNYATPRDQLPEKVAELVKQYHLEDWVLFSSFNPFNLLRIRRLLPECPVAILALEGTAGWLARSFIGGWFAPQIVHPYLRDATKTYIRRQHDRKRRVHVWTVNEPADMQRLFKDEVDGIFTDDPVRAQQLRNQP